METDTDTDTDGTVTTVAPDMDTDGTVTTVTPVTDTAMAAELTRSVMPLNQVAPCIANTNHGVMQAAEKVCTFTEAVSVTRNINVTLIA